jgi:hypothetical protein
MRKKYAIEIYPPGNKGYDTTCLIESNEPFLTISRGDIINPRTWTQHYNDTLYTLYERGQHGIVLKVTGIEHVIIQTDDDDFSQHRLLIFTEALPDIADSRP